MSTKKPGCLATIFGIKPKASQQNSATLPYRLASEFFTPAEANFYHILKLDDWKSFIDFP